MLPTTAKVRLDTNKGPITVGVWAKEHPEASGLFLRRCFHEKYTGAQFTTIDKSYIGTTTIELAKIKREHHSRLRFTHRGMVGFARDGGEAESGGFFITLKEMPEFNGQHVIVGQVEGEDIYNVVKMAEGETKDGVPLYPGEITGSRVLEWGPVPEETREERKEVNKPAKKRAAVRLDYDEEEEEVEFEMKPAHELLGVGAKAQSKAEAEPKTMKETPEAPIDTQQMTQATATKVESPVEAPVQIETAVDPVVPQTEVASDPQDEITHLADETQGGNAHARVVPVQSSFLPIEEATEVSAHNGIHVPAIDPLIDYEHDGYLDLSASDDVAVEVLKQVRFP